MHCDFVAMISLEMTLDRFLMHCIHLSDTTEVMMRLNWLCGDLMVVLDLQVLALVNGSCLTVYEQVLNLYIICQR